MVLPAKNLKFNKGFSLIELLIVITLLVITATIVSTAYSSYADTQKVKNAALVMKNDIRFAQNNATSGRRGCIVSTFTLIGWAMFFNTASNGQYTIFNVCLDSATGNEDYGGSESKTVTLPSGITISSIRYGSSDVAFSLALFRALYTGASFHNNLPFTTAAGLLQNLLGPTPQQAITVVLTGFGKSYEVIIQPTGEVNENEI